MPMRDPDERELDAVRSGEARPDETPDEARSRRLGAAARALSDEDHAFDDPPPGLWERIAVEADDDGAEPGAPWPDRARRPSGGGPPRGARSGRLVAAAALVVVLLVAVGVLLASSGGDDDPATLATARLEPLPDAEPGVGPITASVVDRGSRRELDVDLDLPRAPGYYELWLIDPQVEGMVSLGPLRSDGRYQVPDDVDIAAFPIVDVSVEQPDGVPTHSGVSVLRGTLA